MDLIELREQAAKCKACSLHEGRIKPVFDKGNPSSSIFICGMVPADEENKIGLPFVGRAGQLLDIILNDVVLTYEDVYITNIVKCYLAAGKSLKDIWVSSCLPYLINQIYLLRPKVIITLGMDATSGLLGFVPEALGQVRGKPHKYSKDINIIPTYHPSYLLRGGGPKHKFYHKVLKDFNLAKKEALLCQK